jgi:hypothetical protein
MTFVRFGTAAVLGLSLAAYFLWEVAEPVRTGPSRGGDLLNNGSLSLL